MLLLLPGDYLDPKLEPKQGTQVTGDMCRTKSFQTRNKRKKRRVIYYKTYIKSNKSIVSCMLEGTEVKMERG